MKSIVGIAALFLAVASLSSCGLPFAPPTQNDPTYSLTYDKNGATGGVVPAGSTSRPGVYMTVAGNTGGLNKAGSFFDGWNSAAGGGGVAYTPGASFAMPALDLVLYAQWRLTGSVTYDPSGAASGGVPIDGAIHQQGSSVTVLGNTGGLVKSGWTFAGWSTQPAGAGTIYAPGATFTMGGTASTLYAVWTQGPTYTVTYDANGGTGTVPVDANEYLAGGSAPVLGNVGGLTRTNYTFAGWSDYSTATTAGYSAASILGIGTASVTLYAVWTMDPTYKVTYYLNGAGGTAPSDANNYLAGATVTVLGNAGMTRTDYTFAGWNTLPGGGVGGTPYAAGDTFTMGSAAVGLYAQWVAVPKYNVTYDANGATGGTAPTDSAAYKQGDTYTLKSGAGLSRTSFAFAGWSIDPLAMSGAAAGTTATMGSANVTLHAVWTPTYPAIFFPNAGSYSGSEPATAFYADGATATAPDNTGGLAVAGYAFAGWNTASDGSGTTLPKNSTFTMTTAGANLYAIWIPTMLTFTTNATAKTITITGTNAASGDIVIPGGVTTLATAAFLDATLVTGVSIPASIATISPQAFKGCTGLAAINLPASVTTIGSNAFEGCTGLTNASFGAGQTSLTIPATVTSVGTDAFRNCTGLTSVTILAPLTGLAAFSGCTNLAKATLPSTLTSLGASAFFGCSSLADLALPAGLTGIGDYAFYNCTALSNTSGTPFLLPTGLASIGLSSFGGCTGLTSTTTTPFVIPASVTSIGSNAFQKCSGFVSVTIPAGLTTLAAFSECGNLTTVVFAGPSSLATLGSGAFYACAKLATIALPAGLTTIGDNAFMNCTALTGAFAIPSTVTTIGSGAFTSCFGITSITLPALLTSLGDNAFNSCAGLTSMVIPEGVTSIGAYAFRWNSNLASVTIPSTVTSIGFRAFEGPNKLTTIDLPAALTLIDDSAFDYNLTLVTVNLLATTPPAMPTGNAFSNCTNLTTINVPAGQAATYKSAAGWINYVAKIY